MAGVHAERVRHFRSPQPRRPVHTSGGHVGSQAVGGHAPHRVHVSVEGGKPRPGVLVPQPDGRVLTYKGDY